MSATSTSATSTRLSRVEVTGADYIALVEIARPEAANAFSKAVLSELTAHFQSLYDAPGCRAVVLRGAGKHFSAGADLAWMQAAAKLSYAENLQDAAALTAMFEAFANLPLPTIALVAGSAFGGAVGLCAAADVAIAAEDARFCLSEVRLGILPAVILPYLGRKMLPGQLRRHALSGRVFSADEALTFGLVQRVEAAADLMQALRDELGELLKGGPKAQAACKELHDFVLKSSFKQGPETAAAISRLRVSPAAQAGFAAFFAKQKPPWAHALPPTWTIEDTSR